MMKYNATNSAGIKPIFWIVIAFLSIAASGAWCNEITTGTISEELASIINSVDLEEGKIGMYVIDAATGREIFSHNAYEPLIPASCNKLLTTSAALYYLGSEYCYKTKLSHTGRIEDKVLHGNLIVTGSGDPTISGRFNPDGDTRDHLWIFENWVDELKQLGIRKIYGYIIGEDDYFDDEYFGNGWPKGERGEWYCAEVSALSFNDNCIDLEWEGARKAGLPGIFQLNPPTSYVTIINGVKTVEKDGRLRIGYQREDKTNIIRAHGTIPAKRKDVYDYATIYNPTHYFATVFKETIEKGGIEVKGVAVDGDEREDQTWRDDERYTVDTFVSPPMASIVKVINKRSQNFYAEQVLKTLGKEIRGEGSFVSGCRAVIAFLEKENIYVPCTVMIDGSGLSWLNRVPPAQLVKVLRYMRNYEQCNIFFDSLSKAGESGTLANRFQDTEEARNAAPRIHGKTGYLGVATSLTGVVNTPLGQEVFFSIIVNSDVIGHSIRVGLIDRLVLALARRTYL